MNAPAPVVTEAMQQRERRRIIAALKRVERSLDAISWRMITAAAVSTKEHAKTCDLSMAVFRLALRMKRAGEATP